MSSGPNVSDCGKLVVGISLLLTKAGVDIGVQTFFSTRNTVVWLA